MKGWDWGLYDVITDPARSTGPMHPPKPLPMSDLPAGPVFLSSPETQQHPAPQGKAEGNRMGGGQGV